MRATTDKAEEIPEETIQSMADIFCKETNYTYNSSTALIIKHSKNMLIYHKGDGLSHEPHSK